MSTNSPDKQKTGQQKGDTKQSNTPKKQKNGTKKQWRPGKPDEPKKPTRGEVFQAKYHVSLTRYKNIKKAGLIKDMSDYLTRRAEVDAAYRNLVKTRNKAQDKLRQDKHKASTLYKRTHSKDKKAKTEKKKAGKDAKDIASANTSTNTNT